MIRQPHSESRERIVADAIGDFVAEMRLVDAADYVAFIRLEHMAALSDLVDSAAELFFMPGTLRLGHGGEAHVSWEEAPRIDLDLELRPEGVIVYFTLGLAAETVTVEINYVSFERPSEDPAINTLRLEEALERARIRPTPPLAPPAEAFLPR